MTIHSTLASRFPTPPERARFLNILRDVVGQRTDIPTNIAGAKLVSDFDILTATDEELMEAISKATK